jgi:hypothetical protein
MHMEVGEEICIKLERQIYEERNNIEIERARTKNQIEQNYKDSLKKFSVKAKEDAERNIQQIERSIHFENEKLSQKTMT